VRAGAHDRAVELVDEPAALGVELEVTLRIVLKRRSLSSGLMRSGL
jgi:hypothetical protein